MNLDGEWRVAFIAHEHPDAAVRDRADARRRRAAGAVRLRLHQRHDHRHPEERQAHRDQAWDLVKYLTTNDHALAELSNGLRNVPSTTASTHSKELIPDAHFATFLKIFANPKSGTSPIMASGASYTNARAELLREVAGRQGEGPRERPGQDLDKQLDAQVKQAKGGGAP